MHYKEAPLLFFENEKWQEFFKRPNRCWTFPAPKLLSFDLLYHEYNRTMNQGLDILKHAKEATMCIDGATNVLY